MYKIEALSSDYYLEVIKVISMSLESDFVGISSDFISNKNLSYGFDRTIKIMKSVIGIGTYEVSKTKGNYRTFEPGDIIHIRVYSNSGCEVKVVLEGGMEYDAKFINHNSDAINKILSVASCIKRGYLLDVSESIERDKKIKSLGI